MNTLKGMLAASDFSAASRHAAERAAQLARATGARLTLVHVQSASALSALQQLLGRASALEQSLTDEAQRTLDALASDLAKTRGVAVEATLARGSVLDEIDAQANALQADLVVLGARGAGFMRRLMLGSTADRLVRRTRHPLLVVRHKPHEPYRRALVAVDFSPWSVGALELARRVVPGAHLVLLHAYEVPFEGKSPCISSRPWRRAQA